MTDTYVVTGAMMMCTFGMAPSSLVVTPSRTDFLSNVPKGNIMDFAPMVNIMPFGMCTTLSNPTVAAATSAAMGVLTPMPCIPAITSPWIPGNPRVLVQGQPALMRSCRNMCMWGGQISFTTDGQMPGVPPVIVPPVTVMMPEPLSDIEKRLLPPDEGYAYEQEWRNAQHAGDGDRATAETLNDMATRYEQAGDYIKAFKARETAKQFNDRADKKQAAAMEAVNNKYSIAGVHTEKVVEKPMTTEELQSIHDEASKEQAQYEQEIGQLDKQLAKDQEALTKEGNKLAAVSRDFTNASQELKAANQEKTDAAEKRKAAEKQARDAEWMEESAKRRGDKEAAKYFHDQKKEAEKTAKQAAKEEKTANDKVAKAEKKVAATSKVQNQVYSDFCDHVDQHKELENQMKTAVENKNAAEQKAYAAQQVMDAQSTLDQHQEAIKYHQETKQATHDKREEMAALEKEEKFNRDESDAWFNAAVWNMNHGKPEVFDATYDKSTEYRDKANEVHQQLTEKEQEYNAAREEMKNASKQAYGDDAMLDVYTADLQLDNAIGYLRDNASTGKDSSADSSGESNDSNSRKSGK